MGSIEENLDSWSNYDWSQNGDEWSGCWGGTDYLWWGTIFPRVHPLFPKQRVLELAPGYGRATQYVKQMCNELVLVDLVSNCIEACKQRFAGDSHIEYHVNDGRSLPMIADASLDLIFSWDSLVHAEGDVMDDYAKEFARVLKPDGAGFIHHSNMGAHRDPNSGKLTVENPHWRAESASAERFRASCDAAGLKCISQELIAWGGETLNDAFTLFAPAATAPAGETRIAENPHFMQEADQQLQRAKLWQPARFESA